MITYKISYAKGESPEKRMKAMLTAGSIEQPGEFNRLLNERGVNSLTRIMQSTVDALNTFLEDTPNVPKLRIWSYSGRTKWFNTIDQLLDVIIPELEKLHTIIRPPKPINTDIISSLKKLKSNNAVTPFQIMKILTQFEVPGVKQIEFKNNNEEVNLERLLDLNYPLELVPNDYNCSILMTIMSDPCKATPTEFVDRSVINSTTSNPFTRKAWSNQISTDQERRDAISLFIKKIEYLYFAFNADDRYKHLYYDESVQGWLQDTNKSYEEFCNQVNQHANTSNTSNTTHFVFFTPEKETNIFPTKLILDLFAKYQIHTLRPEGADFEKLIRRMAVAADDNGLTQLFKSPILDLIKVDVYAKNEKNQTVIDLINLYKEQYPRLSEKYTQCQNLLESFQPLPPQESNGCIIS